MNAVQLHIVKRSFIVRNRISAIFDIQTSSLHNAYVLCISKRCQSAELESFENKKKQKSDSPHTSTKFCLRQRVNLQAECVVHKIKNLSEGAIL